MFFDMSVKPAVKAGALHSVHTQSPGPLWEPNVKGRVLLRPRTVM